LGECNRKGEEGKKERVGGGERVHGRMGEGPKSRIQVSRCLRIQVTSFMFVIPEIPTACHGEAESEDGKS